MSSTPPSPGRNHLAGSASPYLLQHADNPVDWYPWGPEALARARHEDKPIFLSIGYAACHWCHVMAHESFEDAEIAAVMNAHFVNIKVDREERPDLDEIYMQATLALNHGQGGWPMSVWLTPDLKPFFAGTYFPPTSRFGRPGFKEVCERIGAAWGSDRERIREGAEQLTELVQRAVQADGGDGASLRLEDVERCADVLAQAFDSDTGGLLSGATNKFPPSMALDIMLRVAVRRPNEDPVRAKLQELVRVTLDHMADGGIHDQLGGGFHRYSTDPRWHVPHFEKMLYDQALISRAYLDAYQHFGTPRYADVARSTFDYVLRDLQSPTGGFYSSRDADSEGVEGKYYVWTRDEVFAALPDETAEAFCACYDVLAGGNWEDPHDPGQTKNVLRVRRDTQCCAKLFNTSKEEFCAKLAVAREKLLEVRQQRMPPALDDKILCEWNGLMIASLARGGAVLNEARYVDAACRAAEFILARQLVDGRLRRVFRDGRVSDAAFLSDYACLIEACLELYEATFEPRWLEQARALNATLITHYWDAQGGGFFFTPDDHEELIARSKDVRDGAHPSGNSVQLMNLLRLATIFDDEDLRQRADRMMHVFADEVRQAPWAAERFLAGVEYAHVGPVELAVVGDPRAPSTQALLDRVDDHYLPNRVLMLANPHAPDTNPDTPLLRQRAQRDGTATAYVCREYTCQRPVTSPEELGEQLRGAP